MAEYIKLGDKALSFTDPTTHLKLRNDQVVKETKKMTQSKKYKAAKLGGHITRATEEEYNEYLEKVAKLKSKPEDVNELEVQDAKVDTGKDEATEGEHEGDHTAASLNKLKVKEIIELINDDFEHPKTQEELELMKKPELIDLYLEYQG